jgi:phosphoribosylamine---glycine ligase
VKVCVVGSGGREHAVALALSANADVVVTPGNEGMRAGRGEESRGAIATTSGPADQVEADLYVIGPEAALVDGLADRLRAAGGRVVGPGADGARLEGSKAFMKELLCAAGVPTARHGVFSRLEDARRFLRTLPGPWVVKTDGLAAGKGVLVAGTIEEAEADIEGKLSGTFGEAGRRVVVEEGLRGIECSLLALCDGVTVVPLVPAQDFKRVGDGDRGANTGGMGAYAPASAVGEDTVDEVVASAVEPLVYELRRRGIDYRGVLYAGLMLTSEGPRVLEYNVRLGDPEAQVVLPLVEEDLVALFDAVARGELRAAVPSGKLATPARAAVCVVLAAEGYPGAPRVGDVVHGLDDAGQLAEPLSGVTVLHAGTRRETPTGSFRVAGGRVLDVAAVADDVAEARRRAYAAAETIDWPGIHYRRDIAEIASRRPDLLGAQRSAER